MRPTIDLPTAGTRVFDQILEYFKKALVEGDLKPGDHLPPERQLASSLGVGRSSLREALRALEILGLVSIVAGQGTFVLPPNTHSLSTFLEVTLALRPTFSENILEARTIIECEAVRLAAKRASAEERAHMREALEQMLRATVGDETGPQADFAFHNWIIQATRNDFLIFLYDAIEVLLRRGYGERWRVALANIPGILDLLGKAHKGIFEAIEARNSILAEERMREHFKIIQSHIGQLIKGKEE